MPVSCSHPAAGGSRPSLVLHSSLLGQRGKVFQGQFGGKREKAAAAAAAVLAPRSFQQPPTTSDCGRSTSPFYVVGNWKKIPAVRQSLLLSQTSAGERNDTDFCFSFRHY